MDGVLADFAGAFRGVEEALFGSTPPHTVEQPEDADIRREHGLGDLRARQDAVWKAIQETPDFWLSLAPMDARLVRRLYDASLAHRWEVVFVTRRPPTAGDTVQRQTQRWLALQGLELPSVIVLGTSRGAAMRALRIDYLVDDSLENCLDTIADASARTILVSAAAERAAQARKLGVAVAAGPSQALDLLEEASRAASNPSLFQRFSAMVGWR